MQNLLKVLKLVMQRGSGKQKEESTKEFVAIESKPGRLFAIDGGNATIYDGGAWILSKIRTAVVGYDNKKRVFENRIAFELHCLVEKGSVKFDKEFDFPNIDFSSSRFEEIPSEVRAIVERLTALNMLNEMEKGDVMLLDAPMNPEIPGEENVLKRLFELATEKGISLIGVSKTSRLRTQSGRSMLGYLNETGPDHPWVHKLDSKAPYHDLIVKFHPRSEYCYRCHVLGDGLNVAVSYCKDPELIGYPYPLLRVDKLARISQHEKEMERRGVRVLARKMGVDGFEYDIRSQNFHEKLDKRMYR